LMRSPLVDLALQILGVLWVNGLIRCRQSGSAKFC
jgi:hypothetical protein